MSENKYFTFGYRYFGPFLYGFVRWLKKELISKGYDKVFFFSRDGYMMKKAFDLINDTGIKSEYVYFSRRSLRLPLLYYAESFEESLDHLSWERYKSLGKLLDQYGFHEAESLCLAKKYDFLLEDIIPYDRISSNMTLRRIWNDNKAEIKKRSLEQDRLLMQYLSQHGMKGKTAIVDIGWHGNMQYFLELISRKHDIDLKPEGFYAGILPNVPLTSGVNGFLYSPEETKNRKKVLCFLGGYEKLFQSLEGSVSEYSAKNEAVAAKLYPYEYSVDGRLISFIKSWQRGAICFVKKAHAKGIKATDKQLTEPLIRFGAKPSLNDTRLFEPFYNIDGTKIWYLPQKPIYKYHPHELMHAFGESPWKTGFMKALFKVPGPYYLIYRSLKK